MSADREALTLTERINRIKVLLPCTCQPDAQDAFGGQDQSCPWDGDGRPENVLAALLSTPAALAALAEPVVEPTEAPTCACRGQVGAVVHGELGCGPTWNHAVPASTPAPTD